MIVNLREEFCIRGRDCHGWGHYGASRGNRTHNGIDVVAHEGDEVVSCSDGHISKIGYPYSPADPAKGHLRYVEVTTEADYKERYFYCLPAAGIELGLKVQAGKVIAVCQDLVCIYGGMTPHVHFEAKGLGGKFVDPINYLGRL
jgi:murein DD-endopeptidase MepM/ murein hydrolase activator NlpD